MKFLDNNHKEFFEEKTLEVMERKQNIDRYYSSLIYILGLCETTRNHFKEIFDLNKEEINIDSIQKTWQTDTSVKVTRMAFSLWNGCNYDSEEDIDRGKVS